MSVCKKSNQFNSFLWRYYLLIRQPVIRTFRKPFEKKKFFFLSGFSFTDTDDSQDSKGRERTIFYSTLPLPPAHEHSDIYLQLCMWDDYHVFLIATLVYQTATRWDLPPYRITIWLTDDVTLSFCLLTWWLDSSFFFVTAIWDGKPVDSNPCITSEPTNQVR